jgi:hypothetical protein
MYGLSVNAVSWDELAGETERSSGKLGNRKPIAKIRTDEGLCAALEKVKKLMAIDPPAGSLLHQDLVQTIKAILDYM